MKIRKKVNATNNLAETVAPYGSQRRKSQLGAALKGLVLVLRDNKLRVSFAESCTGGLLSSGLTALPGVSDVFVGSVVSYDNLVKQRILKVRRKALADFGAVSAEVARQMAEGALSGIGGQVALAITGIAGPSGGTPKKPVGTVFIAVAGLKRETRVFQHRFKGSRQEIQRQSCHEAVHHLERFIADFGKLKRLNKKLK